MPEKKFEDWPVILGDLSEGRDLDSEITEAALISVLRGEATDATGRIRSSTSTKGRDRQRANRPSPGHAFRMRPDQLPSRNN